MSTRYLNQQGTIAGFELRSIVHRALRHFGYRPSRRTLKKAHFEILHAIKKTTL